VIEPRFGEGAPFSVGVEEELMILDGETLAEVAGVHTLIHETEGLDLPGRLKTELFASVVESNTDPFATAGEALEATVALRRAAVAGAERNGLRIAAAGSHPFSRAEEQPIVDEERYASFVAYAGASARRQGVQGLHVHVAVPSATACFHALEGMLPWLPVVLALSCNSPYLNGTETGLASNRAEVLAQLPRSGAPPAFRSYDEWVAAVERLARIGIAVDHTRYWWDIRPAPQFGTLEVRAPDQPTSTGVTGAFVALLQALCAAVLDLPPRPYAPERRGDYAQNRWAALRFGPKAELIHPDGDRAARVAELLEELLELVRPAARRLGGEELLVFDASACEADLQLAAGRSGDLRDVAADVVERSVPSP